MRVINKTLGGREEVLVQLQHNIEDVLNGDSTAMLEYIDQRMAKLRLIEKITVYDDKLIFEFKSGMTIELKR